jgi:hypothetical protein
MWATLKICPVQIPTIHGLSMLKDTRTFPISQSKLEAALFGATFSFKLTIPEMGTLLRLG